MKILPGKFMANCTFTASLMRRLSGIRRMWPSQKRQVSESTKALYTQRARKRGRTHSQFKALQSKIKQAGINDYKDWVAQQSKAMTKAKWQGDTKKIYEIVKTLSGKTERPPTNLTTDGQGNALGCANDVFLWDRPLHTVPTL